MTASRARWEKAADAYASGEHRSGQELELVVEFAAPSGHERLLDIGAGAGHTALALAPHVQWVVVTDPVDSMLAAAKRVFEQAGQRNAEFLPATAERLPFVDGSFEIVTSRLAAHHFDHVPRALEEVARVLRPGGVFCFVDTIAPPDDEAAGFQDEIETLRDSTHQHIYRQEEWIALSERASLPVLKCAVVRKAHPFEPWLERGGADALTMQQVRERFLHAPDAAVRALEIVTAEGRVISFTDSKLVFAARRRSAR